MYEEIKVAVLGSTGYVGLELVKILNNHPNVKINFLGCDDLLKNQNLNFFSEINPKNIPSLELNRNFNPQNSDVVFLALPHGISNIYVSDYINQIKIIDLSADFRLDSKLTYENNYNLDHVCLNLLSDFIYGIPEINKKLISGSSNIAVPGCYPTSILLPLIPLLKKNYINTDNIIIDSKSGYSGAGKNFDLSNIKNSNDFNFYNYNTNEHRHICEIRQELEKHTSNKINFSFNPHILPSFRGMMSTIYCKLNNKINIKQINNSITNYYNNSNFVNLIDNNKRVDFFSIQQTNKCLIKIFSNNFDNNIIIVSVIDNLIKGAAGQAIQCFNIMHDIDEEISLNNL